MRFRFALLFLSLGLTQLLAAQNVSFSTTNYSVPGATTVAIGDFNNDGIPDLAVATSIGNPSDPDNGHIVILLGNGDGTFQRPQASFSVGSVPWSIAVGDFNGDGNLDLAVGNKGFDVESIQPSLSILLGNGDGTFQPETRYPNGAVSVVAADLNGDGIVDLVLGLGGRVAGKGVWTMLGNGDGSFQAAQNWSADCCLSVDQVAVGDFNGDGVPDIVAARGGDIMVRGDVIFLAGNNDGTFQPPASFDGGTDFDTVTVNDFNSDGILDLVVSDNTLGHGSGSTWLIYGNGDGTFSQLFQIGPIAADRGLVSADFNGDTNNDVAVAAFHDATVHILLGDGQGDFQGPIDFGLTAWPRAITLGDLNGDGKPDLALVIFSTQQAPEQVVVMLNTTGQ